MASWAVIILALAMIVSTYFNHKRMQRIEEDIERLMLAEFWKRQGVTSYTPDR